MSEQKQIWKISQGGTGNDYLQRETFNQKVITIGYLIEGKKGYEPKDENRAQVLKFKNDIKVGDYIIVPKPKFHAAYLAIVISDYKESEEGFQDKKSDVNARSYRYREIKPITSFGNYELNNLQKIKNLQNIENWKRMIIEDVKYGSIADLYTDFDLDIRVLENEEERMNTYQKKESSLLLDSKNIIFRGAPGTGKTYLANQVAADIVSNGRTTDISELTDDEKTQIGFVQFHPSYDYTDFVEGLRPNTSDQGEVSFNLKAGSFMTFVNRAKSVPNVGAADNFEESWKKFIDEVNESLIEGEGYNKVYTLRGKVLKNLYSYNRNGMQGVYPKGTEIYLNHDQIYNVYRGLPGVPTKSDDNYRRAIIAHLKEKFNLQEYQEDNKVQDDHKKYVFIIDEINRGEISKIFGELFFSLDPGYRGYKEGVFTQYSNLHDNPNEKFYIPDNVYVIGTMNDIDRSVDTFDFAMRRRFTFLEVTAEESAQNMNLKDSIREQMSRLNSAIVEIGGLTEDYQIGASYFKSIEEPELEESTAPLWDTKLFPLLKDYFRGEHQSKDKINKIKEEYFNSKED